jgi:hypothetical protein
MKETRYLSRRQLTYFKVGQKITVKKGLLWVTYLNDQQDYFYKSGDIFTLVNDKGLIEALETSAIEVEMQKAS